MTIEEIKKILPNVQIEVNGKIFTGNILGRKLDYAKVYVPELFLIYEFSWESVAKSVAEKTVLTI